MSIWQTLRRAVSTAARDKTTNRPPVVYRSIPASQTPSAAPPNRMGSRSTERPVRRVNIGLDFGTSATKVVIRIEEQADKPRFLIVGPSDSCGSVLYPSTVAEHQGNLLFGAAAEMVESDIKARSFKMNLPAEAGSRRHDWRGRFTLGDTAFSAEDISTLYLAWVLKDVIDQIRTALENADVKITINAAAPLDQIGPDAGLKAVFHRVVFRALKISASARSLWPVSLARQALLEANSLALPNGEESPVSIFPETHAAMTSYMLQPGRRRGNYATVDVGAGSTDVAFFWFHATQGQPEMCYYGASSSFVGMDDIDEVLARHSDSAPQDVRTAREKGALKPSEYADRLIETLDKIYQVYRDAFGRSYARCLGEAAWHDQAGHARYTLHLVGGGSLCNELVERLRRALPVLRMRSVECGVLEVPNDLVVLQASGLGRPLTTRNVYERKLLLLAHGLANRAVDIPIYEMGHTFGRVREVAERQSHDELYAR